METISSFIGTDVYCNGKVIGRITDFLIDFRNKYIRGINCISNTGIIRTPFIVDKSGIMHLDRNGVVVDGKKISYKKIYLEEYSNIGISRGTDFSSGSMGDIYFDTDTLELRSVSVKKGFLDDLIYGREILDINDISLTDKGIIVRE